MPEVVPAVAHIFLALGEMLTSMHCSSFSKKQSKLEI
jgi:hypothetical protein